MRLPTTKENDDPSLELALLRLCARVDLPACADSEIRELIRRRVDWLLFLNLAERHRVLPLMHRTLSTFSADGVPPEVLRNLAIGYLLNAEKNHKLSKELEAIRMAFSERRIDMMPIKGPTLAESAYGSLALRQNGDLDILIRMNDISGATKALLSLGYALPEHLNVRDDQKYIDQDIFMESAASLRQFQFSRGGQMLVELHWEIGPRYFPFALNNEALWRFAKCDSAGCEGAYTLPPTLMLLLLIDHASKHGWERLSWVCDIAEFIKRHEDLDWADVIDYAHTLHMTTMVRVALRLASEWLACPLPPQASVFLTPNTVVDDLVRAVDRIHKTVFDSEDPDLYEHYFRIRCSDRFIDRLRYRIFVATTPTAKEWSLVKIPAPLAALYRGVRLYRVATMWLSGCRNE